MLLERNSNDSIQSLNMRRNYMTVLSRHFTRFINDEKKIEINNYAVSGTGFVCVEISLQVFHQKLFNTVVPSVHFIETKRVCSFEIFI